MKNPGGHEFEYKLLRPSQLRTDPLYQRALDMKRVEKIVREWDGDTFNEPKVSYRDGVYWIFDGQQSTAAWRKLHNNEDVPLWCKVYKGMTWLDECNAFMKQNGISKDPTTNDKLRAANNSKNPAVNDMVKKAELCGFTVDFSTNKTPTRYVCTSTLFRSYNTIGADAFLAMLTVIRDAWYGDIDAVSQQITSGMTQFFKTYAGHFDTKDLTTALKKVSPSKIIRDGKTYINRTNTYGKEIVGYYNKGKKRYRLDETKM